jgi:hypothetical protein
MRIRLTRCLVFFALLLPACSPVEPSGPPRVRIANRTAVDFDRVIVGFPSQREDYGSLMAGEASAYRPVGEAYRYAYVQVQVDTGRVELWPIDYFGETLLPSGRYTYALSSSPSGSGLVLEFEER